ncbi:betaGal beta-1 3-N-acetylglucosaminyltransferase-like protein 1 [Sarcoptes scabiei]|nr:betaGal beta-1 3-N-acetylglucosaminyltransferase-like protein 1 [Sarcoptes scabiei]
MAAIHQQTNITDFFQTVSSQSKSSRSLRSKKIFDNVDSKIETNAMMKMMKNSSADKTTPIKRRNSSSTTIGSSSKKTKTVTKKMPSLSSKQINRTDSKVTRNNRYPIDFGPVGAIRKLDFNDCIEIKSSDDESSNDQQQSFHNFLHSSNQSEAKQTESIDDPMPLINLSEMQEKLRSCRTRSDLKAKLSSTNGGSDKIRQFKSMKIEFRPQQSKTFSPKKSFGSPIKVLMNSPIKSLMNSPMRSLFNSPKKSAIVSPLSKPIDEFVTDSTIENQISPIKTPTKCRNELANETEMPLSIRFKHLLRLFKLIDYNCYRMFNRKEVCTFDKLKQIVENSTRKSFTLDELLKVLTVDRDQPKFRLSWEVYAGQLKLTLTPILTKQFSNPLKCLNSIGHLLEREKHFYNTLMELTRIEHLKFLSEMNISLQETDKIFRWHPMFRLDLVPDIVPDFTLIPDKPQPKIKNTIPDYFQSVRKLNIAKGNKPLCNEINSSQSTSEKTTNTETIKIKSGILKGISANLLKKVREKEAKKAIETMERPIEKMRELRTLSKLPETVQIIYDCFVNDKSRTIEMENLLKRIADSQSISIEEIRKQMKYLIEFELDQIGTKWITLIELKQNSYVQIDLSFPLSKVFTAIKMKMKEMMK